jgi:hypothetical protein
VEEDELEAARVAVTRVVGVVVTTAGAVVATLSLVVMASLVAIDWLETTAAAVAQAVSIQLQALERCFVL